MGIEPRGAAGETPAPPPSPAGRTVEASAGKPSGSVARGAAAAVTVAGIPVSFVRTAVPSGPCSLVQAHSQRQGSGGTHGSGEPVSTQKLHTHD